VRRLTAAGARLAVLAATLGCWQWAAKSAASPYFLPPVTILADMHQQWFSGPAAHLWLNSDGTGNLLPSLGRMLGGLAAAGLAGTALGIAIGRIQVLSDLTGPVIHFCRAIPPPAMVPVFLFIFRIGTPMETAAITFGVIWPVLLNAIDGAQHVHPGHMETARAFRLGPAQRLLRVILPSAAPKIFAGLRVALAVSMVLMIVSEAEGSTDGIGRELSIAQANLDIPVMWAVIVLLGLLGIALNAAFLLAERRALAWQHAAALTG